MTKIELKDLEDRQLVCIDCGDRFIWTAGEQKFYLDKGLKNLPKRCKICTAHNKSKIREKHPAWWIKCKRCGKKNEVSFEPTTEDVLCENCFQKEIEKRDKLIAEINNSPS